MKNTLKLAAIMFTIALVGFTVKLNAQSINDQDLLEVASGINIDVQHTDIGSVDIKSTSELNEATEMSSMTKLSSLKTIGNKTTGIETEGPEGINEGKPGPDLDGPGGSTYQFNGEETGNH
ncbi:MAG: hypothetical protein ACYCVH_06790 [Ignavibacteriaceae bacterium]